MPVASAPLAWSFICISWMACRVKATLASIITGSISRRGHRVAPAARPAEPETPAPAEPIVQFAFGLRKSLRKELARLAADADMTMRAFILDALKKKKLPVTEEDLADLRRR